MIACQDVQKVKTNKTTIKTRFNRFILLYNFTTLQLYYIIHTHARSRCPLHFVIHQFFPFVDCENPDRALNQDANVATFIRILEHSRSVTAFDMIPETDQSHDLKHRPHTAAPTVNSHAHGADMLPNNPEGVGYHEHRPKYMAVDKRERSAEAPFRWVMPILDNFI